MMDRYYYGPDGLPPMSTVQMAWDAVKVAAPTEFQSLIPPTLKASSIFLGNVDMEGTPAYRGEKRLAKDEINDYMSGGIPTHNLSIATGKLLDTIGAPDVFTSPAKIQGAADSYIAQNPLSWIVGSIAGYPRETQHTMIGKAAKYAFNRKFLGVTNPGWVEYEDGTANQKEAGSETYYNYREKIVAPLHRFDTGVTNANQFMSEMEALADSAEPMEQTKMIKFAKGEIRAKALLNEWEKIYKPEEIWANIPYNNFWRGLKLTASPKHKARRFFDEYLETENKDWRDRYIAYGYKHGLFSNRWFKREFGKLSDEYVKLNRSKK
tara:strand:- start:147 stop:1112 length:966 start_codon:yes stop_codon:yes gene_type:complete